MKHFGRLCALGGLAIAAVLFARQGTSDIVARVAAAWPGLVAAALFHAVPMALNGRAWQVVLPGAKRPRLHEMTLAVWLRGSVNALLPVARVGGELVAYRVVRHFGVRRAPAAAGLVVTMALSLCSQIVFTLLGVALLVGLGRGAGLVDDLLMGALLMVVVAGAFLAFQRLGAFAVIARIVNGAASGRFGALLGHSARVDRAVSAMYRRRAALAACFGWQTLGWLAGAGEIWLALHFLGHPVGVREALAIEAIVQAATSVAFAVPGALGVQEAAFLVVGTALGIDGPTALALAASRRLRDAVVFFPGLLAWHRLERAWSISAVYFRPATRRMQET
jgi:putative membrane protein